MVEALEAPVAGVTEACRAFKGVGLGPLIQEDHFGTVGDIRLNVTTIEQFVHVVESDNVVVDIPPNLQKAMRMVEGEALGADAGAAIQAEDVSLAFFRRLVKAACSEEFLRREREQP